MVTIESIAGATVLPVMWVFTYKFDENGFLIKYKAWLAHTEYYILTERNTWKMVTIESIAGATILPIILLLVSERILTHPNSNYIWMQDNASSHRSRLTQANLVRRAIRSIRWPRYSPDWNLIEHVWNWMKNYIQKHYY